MVCLLFVADDGIVFMGSALLLLLVALVVVVVVVVVFALEFNVLFDMFDEFKLLTLDKFKSVRAYFCIHGCFITFSNDKLSFGFFSNKFAMRSCASGNMVGGNLYSTRVIF